MIGRNELDTPEMRARRDVIAEVATMIDDAISALPHEDFRGAAGDALEALLWRIVQMRFRGRESGEESEMTHYVMIDHRENSVAIATSDGLSDAVLGGLVCVACREDFRDALRLASKLRAVLFDTAEARGDEG